MAVLDLAATSSEGLGDRYRQVVGPLLHMFHRHPNELLVCDAVAGQQLNERIVADRRGPEEDDKTCTESRNSALVT